MHKEFYTSNDFNMEYSCAHKNVQTSCVCVCECVWYVYYSNMCTKVQRNTDWNVLCNEFNGELLLFDDKNRRKLLKIMENMEEREQGALCESKRKRMMQKWRAAKTFEHRLNHVNIKILFLLMYYGIK